ncbi:MAG: hypothetical protein RL095_2246 [Verrucomicrobiota bacterium]|jgi:hypothetical protein
MTPLLKKQGQISIRTLERSNENHHLWNNNGIWNLNYTMHPTPTTKQRIRVSLGTSSIEEARAIRDRFFREAGAGISRLIRDR